MKTITDRRKFPKCIRKFKEVNGICVGGCVINFTIEDGQAHAHLPWYKKHDKAGWICLKHEYQLNEPLTLLHEVAHILADTLGRCKPHGPKWRKTVRTIGGTPKAYPSAEGRMYMDWSHGDPK